MTKGIYYAFLLAFLLVTCLSATELMPADAGERIIKATDILTGRGGAAVTQETIVSALLELLDVVSAITPDNRYREEIRSRIQVARDLIEKTSLFNDKARQYLSFAYRMMTAGKKFERPKELDEFVTAAEMQEKSLKYMRNLTAKALDSLEKGAQGETAKLLLELVIMIITPVSP